MATIRAYTTIEQSRKLTKILPLESADMYYFLDPTPAGNIYHLTAKRVDVGIKNLPQYDEGDIPCWSLASLLGVIPQEIFDGEYVINITEGCDNRWVLTYDHFENRNHSYYGLSTGADNLVDACVAIIEKLNELKML